MDSKCPNWAAILILVPTPSVLATSTGPSSPPQLEQAGEAAAAFDNLGAVGAGRQAADAFLQLIHPAQVYARLPVCVRCWIAAQLNIRSFSAARFAGRTICKTKG